MQLVRESRVMNSSQLSVLKDNYKEYANITHNLQDTIIENILKQTLNKIYAVTNVFFIEVTETWRIIPYANDLIVDVGTNSTYIMVRSFEYPTGVISVIGKTAEIYAENGETFYKILDVQAKEILSLSSTYGYLNSSTYDIINFYSNVLFENRGDSTYDVSSINKELYTRLVPFIKVST